MRVARRRRRRWLVVIASLVGLIVPSVALAGPSPATAKRPQLHVVVEPSATLQFLSRAILGAKHSVLVEMYELADPAIEADLVARAADHVAVRVLLDRHGDGAYVNAATYASLLADHVAVRWADSRYEFHEKVVVVDAHTAFVGTGNLVSRYLPTTRDFWVIDVNHADVVAISRAFRSDWSGAAPSRASSGKDLVWSPGAESRFLSLINRAHHSISIESEELSSTAVINALCAAARRHVAVRVTMTYSASWVPAFKKLVGAGASVHVDHGEAPLYIHAKALCVDCTVGAHPSGTVIVGSQNLGTSSLVYNREVSIETSVPSVIASVDSVLRSDFAAAAPYQP